MGIVLLTSVVSARAPQRTTGIDRVRRRAMARPLTDEMFEYGCYEGNYAMANSLTGARAREK